jgi:hypothetical protein
MNEEKHKRKAYWLVFVRPLGLLQLEIGIYVDFILQ